MLTPRSATPSEATRPGRAPATEVAWPDVASKRGHVASISQVWRHLPTWRQGARWRRRTWRQNVASLAHVASGSQVAWPDVASKCGVTARQVRRTWRQNVASLAYVASGSQVASQDVASKCGSLATPPGPDATWASYATFGHHVPLWAMPRRCGICDDTFPTSL